MPEVKDVVTSTPPPPASNLIDPGESITLRVETSGAFDHVSLGAMLIPTNDATPFRAIQDETRVRWRRPSCIMPYAKIIVLTAILLLSIAGFTVLKEGLWVTKNASLRSTSDVFLKLNGELLNPPPPTPEFRLKDVNGKYLSLHDYRGKVVLLNFWATWCPSCKFEMASMETLHKALGNKGLVVLTVNVRESADQVKAFFQEHQLWFPALLDEDGDVFERFNVWSLPTTFIIGKKGELLGKVIGYRDWGSDQTMGLLQRVSEDTM
jgi:peroxiredoxin